MSETPPTEFVRAIDRYVEEERAEGRINSDHTERDYRYWLGRHADDIANREAPYTNRDDCKRTLAHWANPNTPAPSTARSSSAFPSGWWRA